MTFGATVVDIALRQLDCPYIWAGEGDWCIRGGKKVPMATTGAVTLGFDCAGLVKYCGMKAGAPDLRDWWGAQHLWWHLPPPAPGEVHRLAFYGKGNFATHVGLALGNTDLVLEASGGDGSTLTFADALHRNAKVRVGRNFRMDRLGFRSLEALQFLPQKPPSDPPPDPSPTPRL